MKQGFEEQETLDNVNKVINNVKQELENVINITNNTEESFSVSQDNNKTRIRTIPGVVIKTNNSNLGSSFVLILIGVLTLIFLVALLTFSFLKNINF